MAPELEELLVEMSENRQPDSAFMFPSPQRGSKDLHARSLRESLRLIRRKAGLPWVAFHDLQALFRLAMRHGRRRLHDDQFMARPLATAAFWSARFTGI